MNYFAGSAFDNIREKVLRSKRQSPSQRQLLVTTSVFPPHVVLDLAKAVDQFALEAGDIVLTLRVTSSIAEEWRATAARQMEELTQRGWIDTSGNLTSYRNQSPPEDSRKLGLVVLVGADRVVDSASLADFYRCDTRTIWADEMRGSFRDWVKNRLENARVDHDERTLRAYDEVLLALKEYGCADLFQIADLLRELPLESLDAQDGRDAVRILLAGLQRLDLPSFTGFDFASRKRFAPYVEAAIRFFRYEMFMEERARVGALKTISTLLQDKASQIDANALFEPRERGQTADDRSFVLAVRDYVADGSPSSRAALLPSDFVAVHDKILGFRVRTTSPREPAVQKVSGGAVEMALTALWLTFRDWRTERGAGDGIGHAEISIRGEQFRHDSEGLDEGVAAAEVQERARAYLGRLVGGVDAYFNEGYVDLTARDCGDVSITSQLVHDGVACTAARTSEPSLAFNVSLTTPDGATFVRKFAWRLPDTQTDRIACELITWAADMLNAEECARSLPVFHVGYHEELMRAKDDDEMRRVLLHAFRDVSARSSDLLTPEWRRLDDPMLPYLLALASEYRRCMDKAAQDGLHSIFHKTSDEGASPWEALHRAYEAAARAYIGADPQCGESPLGALLLRAFLVIAPRDGTNRSWVADSFEPSGIATVLHPSVLDMLNAHVTFLFACFNYAVPLELQASNSRTAFRMSRWQDYLDLAQIHMPLSGLIVDENHVVDVRVRGQDLIHRIGSPAAAEATLSTRLLLRYEGFDDDEIGDTEMFAESRESRLLQNILADYLTTHPHARDGISLAVYRNEDLQPVISAVHSFLVALTTGHTPILHEKREQPYVMAITVFTEAGEDAGVARWIQQWKERWEAAESDDRYAVYRHCRFSVSHRVVPEEDKDRKGFARMIREGLDVDIAVLYDFIGAGLRGNEFRVISPYDVRRQTLKFPIIEKPFCTVDNPLYRLRRARVISNPQFRVASLHAEIMASLKSPGTSSGNEHLLIGYGDFAPWQEVVDELHKHTEWVVCVDPSIDDMLVRARRNAGEREREIIGFGSGVGLHGELNYTISTEHFGLSDIRFRLERAIADLIPEWPPETLRTVAGSVIKEAQHLSGLSLVRATGVGNYLHDFMAFSLVSKLLNPPADLLCSHLVSLDAYRHWFSQDDQERPDLLWLTAQLVDDRISLNLHLIECKLAQRNYEHVEKAVSQIQNGLATLVPAFFPRPPQGGDDRRPDQRYWWLQLHRLIASKTSISQQRQDTVMTALERLADGDYDVTWHAAVLAFWTDSDDNSITPVRDEFFSRPDTPTVGFRVYAVGREAVRGLCAGETTLPVDWSNEPSDSARASAAVDHAAPKRGGDGKPHEATVQTDVQPEREEAHQEPSGVDSALTEHEQAPSAARPRIEAPPMAQPQSVSPTPPETAGKQATSDETVVRRIPERILLGRTTTGGRDVYWEFGHPELANRHLLVFGTSGMGKTYAIQCLLCEMGKMGQNALVMDHTEGFTPRQLESETKRILSPKQHILQQEPLPISPFQLQVHEIDEGVDLRETPVSAAKRIAGTFSQVYETIGDQQYSVLLDAIMVVIKRQGDQASLDGLLEVLESFVNDGQHDKQKVLTTISKLRPFVLDRPFATRSTGVDWRGLFSDTTSRCHVFQFAGVDSLSARLVIEFTLWDLNAFVRGTGNKNLPKVVVLDEAQNLDLTEHSPVSKYLTEGRKFGISLILATQTMKNLQGDKLSRLFQAGHKLFFRPADTEMQEHAKLLVQNVGDSQQEWTSRLSSLSKGECYSVGYSINAATGRLEAKAFKIRITSLGERFGNG